MECDHYIRGNCGLDHRACKFARNDRAGCSCFRPVRSPFNTSALNPQLLDDPEEAKKRIDGLARRVVDLQGEVKILKAKIAGQRAAIREKEKELATQNHIELNVDRFRKFDNACANFNTALSFWLEEEFAPKDRGRHNLKDDHQRFIIWLFSKAKQSAAANEFDLTFFDRTEAERLARIVEMWNPANCDLIPWRDDLVRRIRQQIDQRNG